LEFDLRTADYFVACNISFEHLSSPKAHEYYQWLDPTNLELLVYVHENGSKVKMTYDSTLIPTPPAQAPAQPDPVVNID